MSPISKPDGIATLAGTAKITFHVAEAEGQDTSDPGGEWLFEHSLAQMDKVGRLLGVTGVLFLFSALLSTLLNLGTDKEATLSFLFVEVELVTNWPVQVLLFSVVLGSFFAMMYCFAIFASLTDAQVYLKGKGIGRAVALHDFMVWLETDRKTTFRWIQVFRALVALFSIAVLAVSAGTLIYALT